MPRRLRTLRARSLLALAVMLMAMPARTADRSLEYAVKATFLYKFATFVQWPAGTFSDDSSPFVLCVVGADPYGGRIAQAVAGQSVGRHPIVLRQMPRAEPGSRCHASFISGSASQDVGDALKAMAGTPTLTVTDAALGRQAGIVHFVIVDDRVTFDIDPSAAARNHLVISSNLLALAHNLRGASR
jgi:YfiR/HmsC-like